MEDMVIAIIFDEEQFAESSDLAEIIERAQKVGRDIPGVTIKLTRGDAASTIRFFVENGELPTDDILPDGSLGVGVFKKKPVEINAVQVRWSRWSEVCDFFTDHGGKDIEGYSIPADQVSDTCGEIGPEYIAFNVMTTHGEEAVVRHGDWLIPDSKPGTFYPCKPDVFAATYSPVSKGS